MKNIANPIFILLFAINIGNGQALDSMPKVLLPNIIIDHQDLDKSQGVRPVLSISSKDLDEMGVLTLVDALNRLQGISQINTGFISRPVMRGLSGNRVQVILGGLRLEDQKWEDEQGLGLSTAGIKKIEIIKGPAALRYGPEAIGGVINIVEDMIDSMDSDTPDRKSSHLNLKSFSNTLGFGLDYTLNKKNPGGSSWAANISVENHADYADGHGHQAANTRFAMYNLKLGHQLTHGKWKTDQKVYASFGQFGFIKDSSEIREILSESRFSREFEDEHYKVLSLIFSDKNIYTINQTTSWTSQLGWQSNIREELEGEKETELGLTLNTLNVNNILEKKINPNLHWVVGQSIIFQLNQNFGSRIIVPNANTFEAGLFTTLTKKIHIGQTQQMLIEAGGRYDLRTLTPKTGRDDFPNLPLQDDRIRRGVFNYSCGASYLIDQFKININLATGFRQPNLAEMFSDGRHEGTARWDLGDPGLKSEFAINEEFSLNYTFQRFKVIGTIFNNRYKNFIFIAPSGDLIESFPVYKYLQSDARLKGFDAGMEWSSGKLINLGMDYSYLVAKKDDGSWLPLIPANKFRGNVHLLMPHSIGKIHNINLAFHSVYTAPKNQVAAAELRSPSYWLHSISLSARLKSLKCILTCNNLTNTYYNDHLSLLRPLGIRDIGRNVVLNLGFDF